jgi:hypothetical protein
MAAPPSDADRFWARAAAFGALWGSVEVTLGSFLNSLRFPFAAGVLLASIGALLLVAARQISPQPGSSLAIGAVAALCKSISPGGIILGPMIGIVTEALLVEIALLAAPRARTTAALGGALAALWAISQTLLHKVVLYGADILVLYLALARRAGAWLGLPDGAGWWALGGLVFLVAAAGATGGLLGRSIGRAAATQLELERTAAGRLEAPRA